MKFDSSFIDTENDELEIGRNYIYKESIPQQLFLFRLDDIKIGHPEYGEKYITLTITYLKARYWGDCKIGSQTTISFMDGEHIYFGGMWHIYDGSLYLTG